MLANLHAVKQFRSIRNQTCELRIHRRMNLENHGALSFQALPPRGLAGRRVRTPAGDDQPGRSRCPAVVPLAPRRRANASSSECSPCNGIQGRQQIMRLRINSIKTLETTFNRVATQIRTLRIISKSPLRQKQSIFSSWVILFRRYSTI
jgi:hypothetical protein